MHAIDDRLCSKSAEDHAVRRTDTGARQYGNRQLRHHAHVQGDDVTLLHAQRLECGRTAGNFVTQFAVGDAANFGAVASHWLTFPNDREFVAMSSFYLAIHAVEARIGGAAHEPFGVRQIPFEHLGPWLVPMEVTRHFRPE